MGTFVSLRAKKLPFCSRRAETTMSQAGVCWEMAGCRRHWRSARFACPDPVPAVGTGSPGHCPDPSSRMDKWGDREPVGVESQEWGPEQPGDTSCPGARSGIPTGSEEGSGNVEQGSPCSCRHWDPSSPLLPAVTTPTRSSDHPSPRKNFAPSVSNPSCLSNPILPTDYPFQGRLRAG